jgi:hypothetical protein
MSSAVLTDALGRALDDGVLSDAVVAQSGAQAKAIWPCALPSRKRTARRPSVSHDTSVATADVPA